MLTAITRAVSPAMVHCEISFIDRCPIDLSKAQGQHHAYEMLLEKLGARVLPLPAEPALPDSMFVEDPAIVLDELAVILPLGTESRRPEAASLAKALSAFRKLEYVSLPGTLEGGDVLRIGLKVFVGLTRRSNAEGLRQLASILAPHNYEVIAVPVTGCLHLKSAVTHIGGNTLLANRAWFDAAPFAAYDWIDVNPVVGGKRRGVKPGAIGKERVAADVGDGRFEMQAAGDGHGDDFVIVRSEDGSELAKPLGIAAPGEADKNFEADAKNIPT